MDNNEGNVFQDVQTIRNILFGDQLKELLVQIESLKNRIQDLEKENKTLKSQLDQLDKDRKSMDEQTTAAYQRENQAMAARLNEIANEFNSKSEGMTKTLRSEWASSKKELNKRISDLVELVETDKLNHSKLIEMLASALAGYNDPS